jgi:hypothetical protein
MCPLLESFRDQPGFIPINGAIKLSLDLVNSLTIDHIDILLRWHQVPRFVDLKSCKLGIHGLLPVGIP